MPDTSRTAEAMMTGPAGISYSGRLVERLDQVQQVMTAAFWSDGTDHREPIRDVPESVLSVTAAQVIAIRQEVAELELAELVY